MKKIYNILITGFLMTGLCPLAAVAQEAENTQANDWRQTGAVSSVSSEQLQKSFTQNVLNTLYGQIPGLTVMRGSGEPGADSPTLNARGFNTFNTTDRSVLVIVDGFESTMDQLSVDEIETISYLKDAAASTLYGMKAANGVLLVTTKRGSARPLQVNFSAQVGFNNPVSTPKYLDAVGYCTLYDEARANDDLDPMYGEEKIAKYRSGENPYIYPNVNWYDQVLKKFSVAQNYNLNVRGGNKVIKYFALVNFSDNNGFFKGTDSKRQRSANSKNRRFNIRANVDVNITSFLSARLDLAADISDRFSPAGGAWGVYNKLQSIQPNAFPVHNPDGSYGGNTTYSNPLGDLLETGFGSSNSRNILSNLFVKYDMSSFAPGLSLKAGFSFNNYFSGAFNKNRKYAYFDVAEYQGEYYYNQHSENTSMTIDDKGASQWRNISYRASLDYDTSFGKHDVKANIEFFTDENYKVANSSLRDNQFPYRFVGFRGRVGYAFDKRYMFDFVYNYEGSDLYARGKRFGFFPAGAAAWIISNEDFLKDNKTVSFLKFRVSYGRVGSPAIVGSKRYAYTQDYRYGETYYKGYDQKSQSTMLEDNVANLNLTWEKEDRLNVGIDLTLWDKLTLTADYFNHKRSDILVSPAGSISSVLGMSFNALNLGKSTNNGFELSIGWADQLSNGFEYHLRGNFWYAKNRIDYMAEELRPEDYQYRTGWQYDQPFGLVALGLFQSEEEIASSPEQTFSAVKPGDIKYKDMNNDKRIDGDDVCPIGDTNNPKFSGSITLGLSYKGFDFEAMFYGVTGRSVYTSGNTYWAFMNQYSAPVAALDRWTVDNKQATYPRLSTMANPNNTQYSSFWLKDGSFLKLGYVEIGYTLPKKISQAIKAEKIRFLINGTNLYTFHGLKNFDPEGYGGFPAMRTVSAGLKLTF